MSLFGSSSVFGLSGLSGWNAEEWSGRADLNGRPPAPKALKREYPTNQNQNEFETG